MKIIQFVMVFLAPCCFADQDYDFTWQFEKRLKMFCEQENPSCETCLQQKSCSWCRNELCTTRDGCPMALRQSSCANSNQEPLLEQKLDKVEESYREKPIVLDIPQVKRLNATYLCSLKSQNCSACTSLNSCAWCSKTKLCIPYSGESTTNLCDSRLWFHKQCVYTGTKEAALLPTACPLRTSGCRECLADQTCYWCSDTKYCGYYTEDGSTPVNCTKGQWYHEQCYDYRVVLVLIPVLAIIFTPIVAYITVYCVLRLMTRIGYDALQGDADSSDDEDKRKKPIMLRHDSPASKTDRLRRKYNLQNRP